MSEFGVVEYESFPIEEAPPPTPSRMPTPWKWAVTGLVLGLVVGMLWTYRPGPPDGIETAPLQLETVAPGPSVAPAVVAADETLAQATNGFVGDVHVFLRTTDGTAHARVLSQQADPLVVDAFVDPASEPDGRGTSLARTVELADTTRLEIRSSLSFGDGSTTWLGEFVTGWAWNRDRGGAIAWSETLPAYPNATRIHHWDIGGPSREPFTIGGAWQVVDYVGDAAVVVAEDAIGVVDLELGQLYARKGTAPVSVAGVYDGIVLGRSGPDADSVQVDLVGAYKTAPAWWQPSAGDLLVDPGNGWAAQAYLSTVALVSPDGVTEHFAVTATPAWSANRNHFLVPQGSRLVIVDLRDGTRSAIDLGAPIEKVWVSG